MIATQPPTVSVVMPVFNCQQFLAEAVDSILNQTFGDFEFIVVDDGSNDATAAILASYSDSRMHVETIAHAGLIPTLNRGMELATADLIARMDADDISEPQRLAKQVAFLAEHPDFAMVASAANVIDATGRRVELHPPFDGSEMLLELAAGNPVVHGSAMMRRRELPSPVYRNAPEDYLLWVDLVRSNRKIACIREPLYRFRKHAQSYSMTASASQSSAAVDVLQWVLQNCPRDRPTSREKMLIGWGMTAGYALRSNRSADANAALAEFRKLAKGGWNDGIERAVERGVGFVLWGDCSIRTAFGLKSMQLRHRPLEWKSYRELLGVLPPLRRLRDGIRSLK